MRFFHTLDRAALIVDCSGPSRASVERQLAEDERRQLEEGRDFSLDETVTPSVLISTGISLEAEQYVQISLLREY